MFDWCQDLLSEAQRRDLTARLEKGIAGARRGRQRGDGAFPRAGRRGALRPRARHARSGSSNRVVQHVVARQDRAGAEERPLTVVTRDDAYALFELLHAMRDNTNLDLREACPQLLQGLTPSSTC